MCCGRLLPLLLAGGGGLTGLGAADALGVFVGALVMGPLRPSLAQALVDRLSLVGSCVTLLVGWVISGKASLVHPRG